MRKSIVYTLALSLMIGLVSYMPVHAEDFSKNEDYYIKKCSNYTYAQNAGKATCDSFMSYLKNKNKKLKSQISQTKNKIAETKNNLSSVKAEIESLTTQIAKKEEEIQFLNTMIEQLEQSIEERETEVKERMYVTQSQINSNMYVDFIFGSKSFTEMFSRAQTINELTNYDRGIVEQLANDKKNVETQKKSVVDAQSVLQQQKEQSIALQEEYKELLGSLTQELADQKKAQEATADAQIKINEALTYVAKSSGTTGYGQVSLDGLTGDAALGAKIANAALAKQGSLYYWGATGPNMFDCSGLVYYAHNAAGRSLGRTTAAGYSQSGKAISYNQLQPGDVVTFYGYGYVCHIAIYVGNGMVVHAAGAGATTLGNKPNEHVKVSSIGGVGLPVYNYRRLY